MGDGIPGGEGGGLAQAGLAAGGLHLSRQAGGKRIELRRKLPERGDGALEQGKDLLKDGAVVFLHGGKVHARAFGQVR